MRSPLVPVILGVAVIVGAVLIDANLRGMQEGDVRDIGLLRQELDSTGAALARASTAADSTRLSASVADRTQRLQRREFHVPTRQETIDGFWGLTGAGTVMVIVGLGFIAIGAIAWRRGT